MLWRSILSRGSEPAWGMQAEESSEIQENGWLRLSYIVNDHEILAHGTMRRPLARSWHSSVFRWHLCDILPIKIPPMKLLISS